MTPYNILRLDISNGLKNQAINSGMDYLILLEAPTNANVTIKLNDNMSNEIPLKENYAISAKDITNIYVSSDVVYDGTIVIGQSNTRADFELITSPTVTQIDTITKLSTVGESIENMLNFLPSKSIKITVPANGFYDLNTTSTNGIECYINALNGIDIAINNENTNSFFLNVNKVFHTKYIQNIRFFNGTATAIEIVILTSDLTLSASELELLNNYVIGGYVIDGYIDNTIINNNLYVADGYVNNNYIQ